MRTCRRCKMLWSRCSLLLVLLGSSLLKSTLALTADVQMRYATLASPHTNAPKLTDTRTFATLTPTNRGGILSLTLGATSPGCPALFKDFSYRPLWSSLAACSTCWSTPPCPFSTPHTSLCRYVAHTRVLDCSSVSPVLSRTWPVWLDTECSLRSASGCAPAPQMTCRCRLLLFPTRLSRQSATATCRSRVLRRSTSRFST